LYYYGDHFVNIILCLMKDKYDITGDALAFAREFSN